MSVEIKQKSWYFFRYQELVMHDEQLDAYDKSTYAALSMHADANTGLCFPSLKTLAKKAGCSKPRLIKSINNLIEAGYIQKQKRQNDKKGNVSNIYKVIDLAYINDALQFAKDNDEELEQAIKDRLQIHPIPEYQEVMTLVNEINKPSSKRDLQGLVNDIDKPSKRDLHELESNNNNHLNEIEEEVKVKFKKTFGKEIKDSQLLTIKEYVDKLSLDVIIFALKQAKMYGAGSFRYLVVMLNDWIKNDVGSVAEVNNHMNKVNEGTVRGSNTYKHFNEKEKCGFNKKYFDRIKKKIKGGANNGKDNDD